MTTIVIGSILIKLSHTFVIFIYLQLEDLINVPLISRLCIFEYLLKVSVVACLVLPNILQNLLVKLMSDSCEGVLQKTSGKKRVTIYSAPGPTQIQGYLAASIEPAFCTLVSPSKNKISQITAHNFPFNKVTYINSYELFTSMV